MGGGESEINELEMHVFVVCFVRLIDAVSVHWFGRVFLSHVCMIHAALVHVDSPLFLHPYFYNISIYFYGFFLPVVVDWSLFTGLLACFWQACFLAFCFFYFFPFSNNISISIPVRLHSVCALNVLCRVLVCVRMR